MKLTAGIVLALCAAYAMPALAADPVSEIDSLLARGKHEEQACNKFRRKWKSMAKGGLNRESPSHVSKQQGLDALKLLEKYPGRSPSMAKAWDFFLENESTLEQQPDQKGLAERFGQIDQACEVYSLDTHFSLLLKDVAVFPFSKKEKGRVVKAAQHFLQDERIDGSLVAVGMKARLFADYLANLYEGENKDALRQKAVAFLSELESARDQIKPQQKALSDAGKANTVEYLRPELELWKRLHGALLGLIAEANF